MNFNIKFSINLINVDYGSDVKAEMVIDTNFKDLSMAKMTPEQNRTAFHKAYELAAFIIACDPGATDEIGLSLFDDFEWEIAKRLAEADKDADVAKARSEFKAQLKVIK